jgi:hypothetical protein
MAEKVLTIKSASAKYGQSSVYIRRAIRQKDLVTTMAPVSKGSKTMQHTFTVAAYETWRATRGGGSRRDDGRNKYVFYANKENEIQVIKDAIGKALPDFDVDGLIALANPPKSS